MEKSFMPQVCKRAQRINCKTHEAWKIRRAAGLETKLGEGGEGKKAGTFLNRLPPAVSLE